MEQTSQYYNRKQNYGEGGEAEVTEKLEEERPRRTWVQGVKHKSKVRQCKECGTG